jgi:uncharacterized protein with von Willebrand factor type A (vWA) domain
MVDEKSENTIVHDKLDTMTYNEIYEDAQNLQDAVVSNQERLKTVEKLAEDTYMSLFKYLPKTRTEEEIASSHLHNKSIIEKMMGTQEFDRLRTFTKLQQFESAVATAAMLKKMMEELSPEDLDKMNEQSKEAEELNQQVQKLMDRVQGLNQAGAGDKFQQQLKQVQGELQNAQAQQQALNRAIQDTADKMGNQVRRAIREGQQKAEEEVKDFSDFCAGWGLEPGEAQRLPYKEKMALSGKLQTSRKLQRISKIIGRMKRLCMAKQKHKINKAPDEIVDVTIGDDLTRMLPSEIMYLDDELEVLFFQRYMNQELQVLKLEGKDKVAMGPIVCCVDNSASMSGDREIWSKAVALALLDLASKQKRHFACIHFGSKTEIKVIEVDPKLSGPARLEKVIEIGEFFFDGGTDFEAPLSTATAIIRDHEKFKKADIVFITDGQCTVLDTFLEAYQRDKKALDFKCISILIGHGEGILRSFSDAVISVEELTVDDHKVAGQVFELVQ